MKSLGPYGYLGVGAVTLGQPPTGAGEARGAKPWLATEGVPFVAEPARAASDGQPHPASAAQPRPASDAQPRPVADALPRRFQDGRLPGGWVEGVAARPQEELSAAPAHQLTAARAPQPTYEVPQAGGCLCGAVRFAVNASHQPRLVVCCHCSLCQKASGGPHLRWATLDAADFSLLQGTPAEYVQRGGVRRFCGACGTPLSFVRTDLPEELDVSLGAFDNPGLWRVELNIWASQQAAPLGLEALPSWETDPAAMLSGSGQAEL